MKRRALALVLAGLLVIPMTGCNANVRLFGKEIFTIDDKQGQDHIEPDTQDRIEPNAQTPSKDEVLSLLISGNYTLSVDGVDYVYRTEDMLNVLLDDKPIYNIELYEGTQYLVQAINEDETKFVTFLVDTTSSAIGIAEFYYDNQLTTGDSASIVMATTIYNDYFNESTGVLEKKQPTTEEKQPKSGSSSNIPEGTCIYCDGKLEDDDKKSVCKKCLEQMGGMTFESDAPYGRCPSCNGANASDKSYQGHYCDDCFAKIKEEEYKEKHQYGDCVDCGIVLTKRQAESYGGRCPECYARYYDPNFDNSNMGHCERCGEDVDMRYTNEGWGYSNLCSSCTCELQAEESASDYTPWAG